MIRSDEVYQCVKVSRCVYEPQLNGGCVKIWTFEATIMDLDENQALLRASAMVNKALEAVGVPVLEVERVP